MLLAHVRTCSTEIRLCIETLYTGNNQFGYDVSILLLREQANVHHRLVRRECL